MSELLFHFAAADDWASSGETYVSPQFGAEGFIHCATSAQLAAVARRRFCGRGDLLLLCIDPDRVLAQISYENLEGGRDPYPHIYGPLNVDAVVSHQAVRISVDGHLEGFASGPPGAA